jgi:hypothetical protein
MTKKSLPKSNAKTAYGLLSEVRRLILAEPKRYNQTDTISFRDRPDCWSIDTGKWPACGTVGCVAGWVTMLKSPDRAELYDVLAPAAQILGLDSEQRHELFRGSAAGISSQTVAHAKAGARHIAQFQQKYAKQLKAKAV